MLAFALSCEMATRKRNAKSGGACLRPRLATTFCVRFNFKYIGPHSEQVVRCSFTSPICLPVMEPSRYNDIKARLSLHFIMPPRRYVPEPQLGPDPACASAPPDASEGRRARASIGI